MSRVVVLDAGPISLVTNPKRSTKSAACAAWLQSLLDDGSRVVLPEIADYEVRRELLRAKKAKGIEHLDALGQLIEYLPITTAAIRGAAEFWAQARQQGQQTAPDTSIDADMILAGQAVALGVRDVIIATTNVGHLTRFVAADLWVKERSGSFGRHPTSPRRVGNINPRSNCSRSNVTSGVAAPLCVAVNRPYWRGSHMHGEGAAKSVHRWWRTHRTRMIKL